MNPAGERRNPDGFCFCVISFSKRSVTFRHARARAGPWLRTNGRIDHDDAGEASRMACAISCASAEAGNAEIFIGNVDDDGLDQLGDHVDASIRASVELLVASVVNDRSDLADVGRINHALEPLALLCVPLAPVKAVMRNVPHGIPDGSMKSPSVKSSKR